MILFSLLSDVPLTGDGNGDRDDIAIAPTLSLITRF
jgi:hypothetical protein